MLAGGEPSRLSASARTGSDLDAAVTAWSPDADTADLAAALTLARETGGARRPPASW